MIRVLEQDLPDTCEPDWFAVMIEPYLKGEHPEYIRQIAMASTRPARARFRASWSLLRIGEEVPWLATLCYSAELPPESCSELVAFVVKHDLDVKWAAPMLRGDIAALRFPLSGDEEEARWVLERVRFEVLKGDEQLDLVGRKALRDLVFDMVGIDEELLRDALERVDAGRAIQAMPDALVLAIRNEGRVCDALDSAACLRWLVALASIAVDQEAQIEQEEVSEETLVDETAVTMRPLRILWEALYADSSEVRGRVELISAIGRWIAGAPEGYQASRLLFVVARRPYRYGQTSRVRANTGDPVDGVLHGHPSAWGAALTATVLGELAGIDVSVTWAGNGVVIRAGSDEVGVGDCGVQFEPLETMSPGADWPLESVLALAAMEAAISETRQDHSLASVRLARLALRLDPNATESLGLGVIQQAETAWTREGSVVPLQMGGLVLPPKRSDLANGLQDRQRFGEAWKSPVVLEPVPDMGCLTSWMRLRNVGG